MTLNHNPACIVSSHALIVNVCVHLICTHTPLGYKVVNTLKGKNNRKHKTIEAFRFGGRFIRLGVSVHHKPSWQLSIDISC